MIKISIWIMADQNILTHIPEKTDCAAFHVGNGYLIIEFSNLINLKYLIKHLKTENISYFLQGCPRESLLKLVNDEKFDYNKKRDVKNELREI